MPNVSIPNLEKYLKNCLIRAVDLAAEEVVNELMMYIQMNWYDAYDPKSYRRTYDFIRSATKTEATFTGKNEVTSMIYFDTNKIKAEIRPGELNAHASFDCSSVAEKIPAWIERGNYFLGRGYEKLNSLEETANKLQNKFPRIVQRKLKDMGLTVKVVPM